MTSRPWPKWRMPSDPSSMPSRTWAPKAWPWGPQHWAWRRWEPWPPRAIPRSRWAPRQGSQGGGGDRDWFGNYVCCLWFLILIMILFSPLKECFERASKPSSGERVAFWEFPRAWGHSVSFGWGSLVVQGQCRRFRFGASGFGKLPFCT